VSLDGGQTWKILQAPGTTDDNPNGANFGWGYTGQSGRWQAAAVDLSAYAGQVVQVRFEYVTDAMLNQPGWLIDDVRVPELGYTADFEADAGGWEADGFARLENALPQRFVVQVVRQAGGQTTVEHLPLDAANQGQLSLSLARGESATVMVMALTRRTTEAAEYRLSIDAP
ncbi:MAG: immune inhibitor A, partial [Anaerolineales bacterium]|nr:immune inhibitor A [Anaerolineales bacterium]